MLVGGQRKRYKDSLKAYLKDFSIDSTTWENAANDRPTWRSLIQKGALQSETQRSNAAKEKHMTRKARAAYLAQTPYTHWCETCGRGFHARIGLISHRRTHLFAS